jgi:hypothetical protein
MWIELKVNKFIFLIIMGEESSIAREMTKKKKTIQINIHTS